MASAQPRPTESREPGRRWPKEPTLDHLLSALAPEDIFDMRVLEPDQTGVPFLVWISTRLGQHGPRVKGYLGRSGGDQPSFSMTISEQPEVVATSYSDRETAQAAKALAPWIISNAPALRTLWFDGNGWTDRQVRAFVDGLTKV